MIQQEEGQRAAFKYIILADIKGVCGLKDPQFKVTANPQIW